LLKFRADHAGARDAVHGELSDKFVAAISTEFKAQVVQSLCSDRSDFVLFPPKGKQIEPTGLQLVRDTCEHHPDVQIVISDGLSARAVEANVLDLLPILMDGLRLQNFKYGTPVLVRFGRVAAADPIAHLLGARLVINLVGERPGLSSAESLSAYITLNPGPHTISSERTVVSNIHQGGTPALEAGAYIVQLVRRIFKLNVSGVKLQQADG
jgi:ethanolamine ammonia-lyase small subunit